MEDRSKIDQRDQKVGTQTNIAGNVTGTVISGEVHGDVTINPPPPLVLVPHLPAPPRDFTGRDEELQDLLAGFDRGATITGLRGMGGIGKTALAYALAEKLADRYPDGQILVELRGTSPEPMTAGEAMARIIRARHPEFKPPVSEAELADVYHSLLHYLRILLLLDNAASREQVEPLLPPSGCAAIVTSRKRFVMPGLKPKDLDVLPLEDAKKLLLEIADRIGGQAEELARLCGCLPIALRNAASVLAERIDLGVAEYLERLQEAKNRLELVEASFGLSYDLLSPELRGLWCLLSVFPPGAGFDREGAAAVWALDQDSAASSLSDLVKWSLLDFDQAIGRYRLHDLAQDFASSRLPTEEKAEAEVRHSEHYMRVLSASNKQYKQGGENVLIGLALFDREWANIQAGRAWAEREMIRLEVISDDFEPAFRLCNDYPDSGAHILHLRLHPKESIRWRQAALVASRQLDNRALEEYHLGNLGVALAELGQPIEAIEHYKQALKIAREIGDRWNEGAWLGNLGAAYIGLGEPVKAIKHYEQALKKARETGDRNGEATNLGNLGLLYVSLGQPVNAIEHYEQALDIFRKIADRKSEGNWLCNLGEVYTDLGEPRKAIEHCDQALSIAREIGDRRGEGNALGSIGQAYLDLGDTGNAVKHYKQTFKIYQEIGDLRGEGATLGNLGNVYRNLGETWKAIGCYEKALQIYREIRDRRGEGNALGSMGNAYTLLGEPCKAIEYHEQALSISRKIGDRRGEANTLFNMSLAQECLGKRSESVKLAREALDIYEQIKSPVAERVRLQLAQWQ